jgi:hydrophobic/amphiphilic exporter-1 (mainly G- bacteria), HAE1 family
VLDNSAPLANAGVAYIILKPWSERGAGEDLLSLYVGLNRSLGEIEDARTLVVPPPPIQGIGNAAGATMQIELLDSSFDLAKLQATIDGFVANAAMQSSLQRVQSTFRSGVPQYIVQVDRVKAETLHVTVDQVFSALSGLWISSTNSAAPSRSIYKPTRNTGCGRRTSPISRCAARTAISFRSAL